MTDRPEPVDDGGRLRPSTVPLSALQAVSMRTLDVVLASAGLLVFAPVILVACIAVWWQDGHSPFYFAERSGLNRKPFRMVKLRSMIVGADKVGGATTAGTDQRITPIGRAIRRFKLDEITQLWNVLTGAMSLVGPRPNVPRAVAAYTSEEQALMTVRPGITDFSSIVFSDEGDLLKAAEDPDLLYEQIIRPWKSRLGLFYLQHRTARLNLALIALTAVAIVSRPLALKGVHRLLARRGADAQLLRVSLRATPPPPAPPPGATEVVTELPYARKAG